MLKTIRAVHKWGVPTFRTALWIGGCIVSVCLKLEGAKELLGSIPIDLLILFVIFFMELSVTFIDVSIVNYKSSIKFLILLPMALIVILMGLLLVCYIVYFQSKCMGWIYGAIVPLAGIKFLEVWLPSNFAYFENNYMCTELGLYVPHYRK